MQTYIHTYMYMYHSYIHTYAHTLTYIHTYIHLNLRTPSCSYFSRQGGELKGTMLVTGGSVTIVTPDALEAGMYVCMYINVL